MAFKNFNSPHVHIQSLDSASTPKAFAAREVELETGALVITDHGSLAGCQGVYELAKKNKLTPILGLEGYFRDDDCDVLKASGVAKNEKGTFADYIKYHHFTTHFLDQQSWATGVKLLSKAPVERHGQEAKPLFNWRDMEELGATNATITTGCLIGMVQRHLLDKNDPVMALKYYERMRALVKPGNFFVEVFPHVCSHNWVQGVFLVVQEEGEVAPVKLRFYAGKTLRTNEGVIKAEDLAKSFGHKNNKHTHLLAVKDFHTWNERTPARLVSVEHVEDFIQNECKPFAPGGDVQLGANQWMIETANRFGDPILISDDSHYAHPNEKVVQDVRLAQSGSWRFYGSYHRQSSAEAWEYFKNIGVSERDFESWIDNSRAWASRFKDFKLESKPSIPTKFYEELYPTVGASNSLEYTMHLIKEHGRMTWNNPVYVARLKQEIDLLYKNGTIDLLPYFMIDEDACRFYRDNKRLTGPGRGSAAGLLLTYLLGITHVDPIRYGLSVDRFLTVDRIRSGKLPDIDQDLNSRDLLVGEDGTSGWLQQRFGDHVAQISTIMTLKLRSAVLDVARFTLGDVPRDISELTRKFEMPPQGLEDIKHVLGYEDSGNWVEGSITRDPALQAYVKSYPAQWEIVQQCLGLGRGTSRHACAYVIANKPIWEFIPLTLISGVTCTQPNAPAVEALGGLKMDFLVINSLNDIANCILMVQERQKNSAIPETGTILDGKYVPSIRLVPAPRGRDHVLKDTKALCTCGHAVDNHQHNQQVCASCDCEWAHVLVDIWDLPEDQKVFADIATGKTETVFQFNTPGAVQWLRHFGYKKPNGSYAIDSIESMAAFTALDRPGPLDAFVSNPDSEDSKHNMLVEYARRARGASPSPDIFEVFNKLFPETYGVMVYQEQLQRLYQEVTGCSGADAEEFRSNVAKKKKDKIIAAYPVFMDGATKQLGSKANAEAVWGFINSWAAYGFNKSHAVCYVVIAYACAYLKHHYPLEWWTSVLRNATKEEINESFWRYCGHLINLPDVTKTYGNFTIVDERIQAPLSILDGVGPQAHKELLELEPFESIGDVVRKIEAKKAAGSFMGKGKKKVKTKQENGEVVETTIEVDKIVKGRCAINRGIIYKLLVSGAMDALFPAGTTTLEMMEEYEQAVLAYENTLRAGAAKPKKAKKAPEPVKAEFINLNQYTRYQLRKSILPAYSEPVLKMLIERGHMSIFESGHGWHYRWKRNMSFVGPEDLERINHAGYLPDSGIRVAVAAYVTAVRPFAYGARKEKQACEINLDVNGARMKFVRWPDRETGELDVDFQEALAGGLEGALVICVLSKFKEGKPFSLDALEVIQRPLGTTEESPEPEESK